MVLVQLLRVATFLLGIVQLIWIARYVFEDFGGIIGVVVAWVVFPITLIVSPIYGVLAHGDWLGVLLFAIGPVTFLLLGLLAATRIGDIDRQLGQTPTPRAERRPSSPPTPTQLPAREPYRDPVDLQIDQLGASHPEVAEVLRGFRDEARGFHTDGLLAADAIWTIVREAWPDDQADAFFAARDEAELRLGEADAEVRDAAQVVVKEIGDNASTAIRLSAMIGSTHLSSDEQNRADDRAMWQAGGAQHVARAAVLAHVLGEQLDEATSSLLQLPWLALCETGEDDRYDLIAAAEERTLDAFQTLAVDRLQFREPDQPRTAFVRFLEPLATRLAGDDADESADDESLFESFPSDEEEAALLFDDGDEPDWTGAPSR
jgi:hypothetical protein